MPLGASPIEGGVHFALYSSRASRVEVCLFDADSGAEIKRFELPGHSGDIWHGIVPGAEAAVGTHYAFYVHGPASPQQGDHFDASIALLDPYARSLSVSAPLRSVVAEPSFDWGADRSPAIAWHNTVIYELHVKGFTQLHPAVPAKWRGKYLGLSVAPVIEN